MATLEDDHVLMAAIDFGTTLSGYCFSFTSNPSKAACFNWTRAGGFTVCGSVCDFKTYKILKWNLLFFYFQSAKTATSVLLDPDGDFLSFGFDAEDQFANEVENGGSQNSLFRHFKMELHTTPVRETVKCAVCFRLRYSESSFIFQGNYKGDDPRSYERNQKASPRHLCSRAAIPERTSPEECRTSDV